MVVMDYGLKRSPCPLNFEIETEEGSSVHPERRTETCVSDLMSVRIKDTMVVLNQYRKL